MRNEDQLAVVIVLVVAAGALRTAWRTLRWIGRRFIGGGGRPRPSVERWGLSLPLLHWSDADAFTLGHAVEGVLALGATGSGKTSGSGRALALAYLRHGFGGLVLTAKADERRAWEEYCRLAGRGDDLVVFGPPHGPGFNFLDHELQRSGDGAGLTENIVNLFSTVLEAAERGSGGSGREDEGYWKRANRQLMRNLVDLLALAKGRLSVPDLYRLVVSAPVSPEQVKSEAWRKESFCFQCLAEAEQKAKTPAQQRDLGIVADYFLLEFAGLSDKTRSVVVSTFTSMADVLQRGILCDLFCADTTVTPEIVQEGKILLIDLPVKEYAEVGVFAQVLWKYCFQRSIERRDVTTSPRPVFLWADEAQNFVTSYDQQFQTTCRSARVATVLLSQNLSNFHAALGGAEKGKAETASLFGNLNTKIFHANGDPVTNEWAATLIGRSRQCLMNANSSQAPRDWFSDLSGLGQAPQSSAGMSEAFEFELQPSVFSTLRSGGPANGFLVDAVLFAGNRSFASTGKNWTQATFCQRP